QNWGFDAGIDYNNQITKDLFVSFKGTFTFAQNKILERDEPLYRQYPNLSTIGLPANSFIVYLANGLLDQSVIDAGYKSGIVGKYPVAPGDIYYQDIPDKDGNVDGVIDANDRIPMGYPTVPEIIYGFGPSIKFKKFDLSLFFQGAARVSLMMSGFHPFTNSTENRGLLKFIADDCWTTDNPNLQAAYPRLSPYENTYNQQASSFWLRDASFLKLKNAEIGYTHKKMRFYLSGSNLLTFSKFKLWDPEMGGGSGMAYPTQTTFNVGFQMTIN
ncbi:MAG: SusC/RagA family protein, partial [Bacteroides sp.]|nr:SusC/RagA family protein [Bacteroides sp.]